MLVVQYFKNLSKLFYKDYPKKLITNFLPIDFALSISSLTIKPSTKQKQSQPAKSASKQANKN